MKILIIILTILTCSIATGQVETYQLVRPDTTELKGNIKDFDTKTSFSVDKYDFNIGYTNDQIPEHFGLRLFIEYDSKVIYKSYGQQDAFYLEPYFFISNKNPNKIIVIAESGTEYSWGVSVLKIENGKTVRIGSMNLGLYRSNKETGKIIDWQAGRIFNILEISEELKSIRIGFKSNEFLALNPGTDKERAIKSDTIYYFYDGAELTMKTK